MSSTSSVFHPLSLSVFAWSRAHRCRCRTQIGSYACMHAEQRTNERTKKKKENEELSLNRSAKASVLPTRPARQCASGSLVVCLLSMSIICNIPRPRLSLSPSPALSHLVASPSTSLASLPPSPSVHLITHHPYHRRHVSLRSITRHSPRLDASLPPFSLSLFLTLFACLSLSIIR